MRGWDEGVKMDFSLKKSGGRLWIRFIRLRIETSGEIF
jgi:hypothetical protein